MIRILLISITFALAFADVQLAPDGTYVDGTPQLAPDGSYVGEGDIQLTPDGNYITTESYNYYENEEEEEEKEEY